MPASLAELAERVESAIPNWVITDYARDLFEPEDMGSNRHWCANTDMNAFMASHARHGRVVCFRIYDDDWNLYFKGYIRHDHIIGDKAYEENAFAPLDWARGFAGCTTMKYLDPKTMQWEVL